MDEPAFVLTSLCVLNTNETTSPERRLCCAVLGRALSDLADSSAVPKPYTTDAINWVTSRITSSDHHFTFSFICEALDLSKGAIDRILEITEEARARESERIRRNLLCSFEQGRTEVILGD